MRIIENIKQLCYKRKIQQLIDKEVCVDKFVLDLENVFFVYKNEDENGVYKIVHKRFENGSFVEVSTWYTGVYYNDYFTIGENGLIKIDSNFYSFKGLYDYIKGCFIVPLNTWCYLTDYYLANYGGYLANFKISLNSSKLISNNLYTKIGNIKSEKLVEEQYFALINEDGTIRGNKLFKGNSLSQVTEIIDLSKYENVDVFKIERTEVLKEYAKIVEKNEKQNTEKFLIKEVFEILQENREKSKK